MPLAAQRAWQVLGWTQTHWALGTQPESWHRRWTQLTSEERTSARYLGLEADTWHGCAEWEPHSTSGSNATEVVQDPNREIQARMKIQRPYSEISGHVHGRGAVSEDASALPGSFVIVFERAVGRALFCGNPMITDPDLSDTPEPVQSEPPCMRNDEFIVQNRRVRVVQVSQGSIIVDFVIRPNRTADEEPALQLLRTLQRQLQSIQSPLCNDPEFKRYARAATVSEISSMNVNMHQLEDFESLRKGYTATGAKSAWTHMCNLHSDRRNDVDACSGTPRLSPLGATASTAALAALVLRGWRQQR